MSSAILTVVAAHLLALDAGTTGVTGLLFDRELRPVARVVREFPQGFPSPGRVEHEAGDIRSALDAVLAELFERPAAADVAAIGITNQRETVFALDRTTGEALAPGIVWQDRRTAARCGELRSQGREELVRSRTGLLLDPYFSATKIEWMLSHVDGLRARADRGEVVFATVDALVLQYLTGGAHWCTEPTNASRTMLFDIERRAWDGDLAAIFGAEPGWLPEVRPSRGDFGLSDPARTGGRSIPIRGMVGDQQAALFGQGCLEPGTMKVTFGTGTFLLLNTGAEQVHSSAGLLTTIALGPAGEPVFALEGSVFTSGAAIQWLRDGLGMIESAAEVEALAREVETTDGVFFVPAFTGLGAPHWDAQARAAILGLTRGSTRAHIARAALEGIAFQNAELVELLRADTGLRIERLLADGGAAANDLLLELQADIAGLTVLRPPSVEATARGAALLAGLGVGILSDPREAAALADEPTAFAPRLPEDRRCERLSEWHAAVARVRGSHLGCLS